MNLSIELIIDNACPNIEDSKSEIIKALNELNLPATFTEIDREDAEAPDYAKKYGSPTVLVNGKDVSGIDSEVDANCCRIYTSQGGRSSGVPPAAMISRAIQKELQAGGQWKRAVASLPATIVALLPTFTCPSCWPFYLGLMSALGISTYDYTDYLLPILLSAILISLGSLLYKASTRHGYKPFILGLMGSLGMIFGKAIYDLDWLNYTGAILLVGASLWNAAPTSLLRRLRKLGN